ncbi:MAG: aspartyl protease family protein, partial [Candidatus Hodarchaeota archaeon]
MQVKIRLDKNSGHIQIPIYVNEKGPYYFTLDTGAGATAVSKTLTENLKLSLSPDNRAKAVGVGGSAPVPVMRSTVDQLRIGSEILENENVVVLDFESIFGAMWTSSGLIGQSILKNYKVTINYRDLILNLDRNHDLRSEEDVLIDWVPFKYVGNTHIIAVPVHINNKGPYDLILDTGSSGTILSPKLVAELGLEQNSTEIEEDQKKKGVDVC